MNQIRVLLADDHTLIRAGLRMVVAAQDDLTVVGEANDGREAVSMADKLKPDVVVMDIGMPNLNGIEACRHVHATLPHTHVVMLSMHSDEGYVLRALKAGAKAYLLKDSAEADLAGAIRAVAAGKSFFSPSANAFAARGFPKKGHGDIYSGRGLRLAVPRSWLSVVQDTPVADAQRSALTIGGPFERPFHT
jgi:DNA-binding NarL/FixJ family response regulator